MKAKDGANYMRNERERIKCVRDRPHKIFIPTQPSRKSSVTSTTSPLSLILVGIFVAILADILDAIALDGIFSAALNTPFIKLF